MHPHLIDQVATARHREMLADAEGRRAARQLARAARIEKRAERRMRRAAVKATRLRAELLT